ncbi:type I-F CRISPR-associated protein Csy2 [Methylomicrobium album]|uniref:CRISPR type I-F/YPEST-associated protein Csy2 n=1 Tax=Methylomicrobium album BG8 TaxID=686340 RepID=H8GLE7_METAL|nr:type I-F CRISPR-associated protein Csy2 [Methylomicrobium album]EIC29312.1 CRISPR type I-F/YPEST-associated protein Csy2 [Methylomicrobium album BG8]
MNRFLIVPQLKIHNANALSSPYTLGFPAMTAWFGGIHALQRQLNAGAFAGLRFTRAAVACHRIDQQTYKGSGDFVHSIIGTGNPLDKTGERPSFIEEARCHLTVSLAIECQGVGQGDIAEFTQAVESRLYRLKLAGGDILSFKTPETLTIDGDNELARLTRKLMPSYVLQERRELMTEAMRNGQDAIDALLSYLKVEHRSRPLGNGKGEWTAKRKAEGWLVPIATGFHGITELGFAENQRDPDTPHRFAESLVTLGEFVMPYRIKRLDDLLWHTRYDAENNLYLCQQNNRI